jgi:hypothetical protein
MKTPIIVTLIGALALSTTLGCEGADSPGGGNGGDGDSDADGDGDADGDTDADSDSDGDPGIFGNLSGTVMAPSGTFPIPEALVYITSGDGSEIPDGIFCYECEDMTGKKWTLSGPDGKWTIEQVPAGTHNIVTRKGFFQRQRQLVVTGDENQDVPMEYTTLPPEASGDGLDQIPNYAVLLNWYDRSEDLLAKLGMAELGGDGHIQFGTESFDVYNDGESGSSALGPSSMVFESEESLHHYHMVFFPCICNTLGTSFVQSHVAELRDYVAGGGKLYGSCYASQWAEFPFPEYIEFMGDDSTYVVGSAGHYDTHGSITSDMMRDWLAVVTPTEDLDNYPFTGAWIKMDNTNDVDDGMGLEEDDGWVKPVTWVTDNVQYPGSPMTVTYNFGCGKVFYSVYQVVESSSSTMIRPQEYVLLYLILEVGVCEGEYIPPE